MPDLCRPVWPPAPVAGSTSSPASSASSASSSRTRRALPRSISAVQAVRDLWLLRERAVVRAAEREFLAELQRVLGGGLSGDKIGLVNSGAGSASEEGRPVREGGDGLLRVEMGQLRERRGVTGMSQEFREWLEGRGTERPEWGARVATRRNVMDEVLGEVEGLRVVTSVLGGEFRHRLEGVLVRRDEVWARREEMARRANDLSFQGEEGETGREGGALGGSLERAVMDLRQEVTVLKNVIRASFDVQLDVQRSIRQEVSAAISDSNDASSSNTASVARRFSPDHCRPLASGCCCICLEESIDSLLYSCGHMCTCSVCGRQLISEGQPCPICRAPIRDVVRAYLPIDR